MKLLLAAFLLTGAAWTAGNDKYEVWSIDQSKLARQDLRRNRVYLGWA